MRLLALAHEQRAVERPGREVEGTLRLLGREPERRGAHALRAFAAQVYDPELRLGRRQHGLPRPPVLARELRPQRLVPALDLREAARQRRFVKSADEAHGGDDVVGRAARLQLVEEPQTLLREGERRPALNVRARDGRRRV